jgi:hypothetical protein
VSRFHPYRTRHGESRIIARSILGYTGRDLRQDKLFFFRWARAKVFS